MKIEDNNENVMTFEQLAQSAGLSFTQEDTPVSLPESFEDTPEENDEVTKPVEEVPPTETPTFEETEAYKVSQFLIKSGQLEDLEVDIDGDVFKLSDAKNLDDDTLKEVLKVYNSEKEAAQKENKVDVSELNSVQQKLINIIKDGDFEKARELFSEPAQLVEPFKGYDPTIETHNEEVFLKDLINRIPNISEKKALALLDIEKSEGTLDETAQAIVDTYRKEFIEGLEKTETETKKQKEERVKQEKQFVKDINSIYKQMEIKDSVALQMTKLVQRDNEGKRPVDNLIQEFMSDPSKASDLVMFLSNKELYDKKVSSKVKNEAELGFAKKINIVKSKPVTTDDKTESDQKSIKDVFGAIKFK